MTSDIPRTWAKGVYVYNDDPSHPLYARLDNFAHRGGKDYILFALWDPKQPGWQEGAALEAHDFMSTYTKMVTLAQVEDAKPNLKFRITATYEYEVNPDSYKDAGFGDNPTVEEMLQVDRDQMWEIMDDSLTSSDDVILKIEVIDGE
jgi:hypothetical protein